MNKIKFLLLFLLLSFTTVGFAQVSIIPLPNSIEQRSGEFTLTDKSVIIYEDGAQTQAEYLQRTLEQSTGFTLEMKMGNRAKRGAILLAFDSSIAEEGYTLEVSDKFIEIKGADTGGIFYAIQTLFQIFPSEIYSRELHRDVAWVAPAMVVEDAPSYHWRSMMLDVARYFYDKEFVMKYIDMMAMYKLNKLQFHFIDDSGWRLEIKKYPRLTEVGAWSGSDSKRLGGYYTQEDIKEIIAYAAVRNVEVIPEIAFPAHMLSAVVAYPWLSCTEKQHVVPSQHFISRDLLCLGKESSYQFLEDVLKETVELFPSQYINIGGDESVYDRWRDCELCQKVQREQGIEKVSELQGYLTNVVSNMMKKYNRTVVGWEEILQRGTVENQVVGVVWRNLAYTKPITDAGHYAVLSPATHTYFDFPESTTPGEIQAARWMPHITVEKCYSLNADTYNDSNLILGVQGCFWSDQFIHGEALQEFDALNENRSEAYAEYLTFPRLLALSEVGWSRASDRDYSDFKDRLTHHYAKLDEKGCGYRLPEPYIESVESVDGGVKFTLTPSVAGAQIVYTTNGSYPKFNSPIYSEPITVDDKVNFRASTITDSRHLSLPIYYAEDYSAYKDLGAFAGRWSAGDSSRWRVDATGKISGNGSYTITFVALDSTTEFEVSEVDLLKRENRLASATPSTQTTFEVEVNAFEAGTPFYIECQINSAEGPVAAFIKKK